jgi:hypothetical protein
MRKLDIDKIFGCLCDIVMHELSTKEVLRNWDEGNHTSLRHVLAFIHEERRNRGLPDIDVRVMPEGLTYSWNEWNSGGGCMIWSCDLLDHYSIHLTDECCVLVSVPSDKYWSLEWDSDDPEEDTQQTFFLAECDQCDLSQGRTISSLFCPWLGQEIADAVERDVDKICAVI